MTIMEAAELIQELSFKKFNKDEAAEFIKAAKLLAAEIDQHINESFLEDLDFERGEDGVWIYEDGLTLKEDEFGSWITNISFNDHPVILRYKSQLFSTISWIEDLEEDYD